MLEPAVGGAVSVALVNAALLALWPVLPGLLLWYLRQSMVTRRLRPEFALRRFESVELNRAIRLYDKVSHRLDDIDARLPRPASWWRGLLGHRPDIAQSDADERDEFEAQARFLRATIARLKRRPLQRLRSWIHAASSKFAVGRAVAVHVTGLAVLAALIHFANQPAWADGIAAGMRSVVWYPFDADLFYANAAATAFAMVVAPLSYVARRARLRREYRLEFSVFKELAETDPLRGFEETQAGTTEQEQPRHAGAMDHAGNWSAVLGLDRSAGRDEIKEAYKKLIKQNHPDRVHGMSPAFQKLAEAETQKLNAAYRLAMVATAAAA